MAKLVGTRHRKPHSQVRLVLCDTSGDAGFSGMIRDWMSGCDYADTRYYKQRVGTAGLADDDRRDKRVYRAVQAAMPRIYNRLAREATTDYVWIVEDDVIPPLDAAASLLRGMDEHVASVAGVYRSRSQPGWVAWDRTGKALIEAGRGCVPVGGNGFGCVLLRRSVLPQTILQNANPTGDYGPSFYRWLKGTRWRARLDWRVKCKHLTIPTAAVKRGSSV